jgi:hypothetical protein
MLFDAVEGRIIFSPYRDHRMTRGHLIAEPP